jgi:hypothetical protein
MWHSDHGKMPRLFDGIAVSIQWTSGVGALATSN